MEGRIMLALFENEVSRILVLPCLGISLAKKTEDFRDSFHVIFIFYWFK